MSYLNLTYEELMKKWDILTQIAKILNIFTPDMIYHDLFLYRNKKKPRLAAVGGVIQGRWRTIWDKHLPYVYFAFFYIPFCYCLCSNCSICLLSPETRNVQMSHVALVILFRSLEESWNIQRNQSICPSDAGDACPAAGRCSQLLFQRPARTSQLRRWVTF